MREVETFLVLAEELHFGRAAERLGISGGRVSQLIRNLEREVGGKLFARTSRRVELTVLGERFRQRAAHAHGELRAALQEAQLSARSLRGRLRVGYLPTIGGDVAAEVVATFEAAHPECVVTLTAVGIGEALIPRGAAKDHDVVLVWSPGGDGRVLEVPGVTVGPVLDRTPRALLVPDDHPLAKRESICLDDLVDEVLIRPPGTIAQEHQDLWTPRFTSTGKPLRHTPEDMVTLTGRADVHADDTATLVSRGVGLHCTVATLLDRLPFPGLALVPIEDMPPMAVVPVWRTSNENAMIRAFARAAAEVIRRDRAATAT